MIVRGLYPFPTHLFPVFLLRYFTHRLGIFGVYCVSPSYYLYGEGDFRRRPSMPLSLGFGFGKSVALDLALATLDLGHDQTLNLPEQSGSLGSSDVQSLAHLGSDNRLVVVLEVVHDGSLDGVIRRSGLLGSLRAVHHIGGVELGEEFLCVLDDVLVALSVDDGGVEISLSHLHYLSSFIEFLLSFFCDFIIADFWGIVKRKSRFSFSDGDFLRSSQSL